MEREAELADAQHEHHEDRQDDRELDERLTVLAAQLRRKCVGECLHGGEGSVGASAATGGPDR